MTATQRKKFQSAKETAGTSNLYSHMENAMYGSLRDSRAFYDAWAIFVAKKEKRPYPIERLNAIGDAVCSGNVSYLTRLKDAIDYFRDSTIHACGCRLADPLRYFMCVFALKWDSYFGAGGPAPTLAELRRFLRINSVDIPRDDTLRSIWKTELQRRLAPSGKPPRERLALAQRFFSTIKP